MVESEQVPQAAEGWAGVPEEFASAAARFGASLHASWPSAEAERTVMEAYAGYTAVLQEALQEPEVARRAAERYAEYTQHVREAYAGSESRQRVLDAFRGYVETLQRAWADVDPATLTPEGLAAIAAGAAWVSGVVSAVGQAGAESP